MRAQIIIFLAVAVLYCESTYYGVNYGLGGANYGLGGANYALGGANYAVGAPTGAVSYVVGGASVPVGGVNYAVSGANYPVGGASFVLGGANYGALGLGYSGLGNAIKVPVGYGTAGLPYSTVSVIKAPVVNSAPLDIGSYAVVNDVLGSNYAVVDAGYGAALKAPGYAPTVKIGYGSNLGVSNYVVKK